MLANDICDGLGLKRDRAYNGVVRVVRQILAFGKFSVRVGTILVPALQKILQKSKSFDWHHRMVLERDDEWRRPNQTVPPY